MDKGMKCTKCGGTKFILVSPRQRAKQRVLTKPPGIYCKNPECHMKIEHDVAKLKSETTKLKKVGHEKLQKMFKKG